MLGSGKLDREVSISGSLGAGSRWFASPFLHWTLTHYDLPVYIHTINNQEIYEVLKTNGVVNIYSDWLIEKFKICNIKYLIK
jgi:hypothetical protein